MSSPGLRGISAAIEVHGGRPGFVVDGQWVPPIMYGLSDIPGSRTWKEQPQRNIRLFAEQGIRLFQVDVCLCHCWTGPGQLDLAPTRRELAALLEACPDALAILRLHVNPPHWWMKANPDEMVVYDDGPAEDQGETERLIAGDMERVMRVSLASELWLTETGEILAAYCQQLAATPEGCRTIGLQLACGAYGEWHYWAFPGHEPDYGTAMAARFRRHLATKYGTDEALRQAWGNPVASIATAVIPDMQARRQATDGALRDPRLEQAVIDSLENLQGSVADAIIHFCRITKESWPRPIATGTFYGYFFTIGVRAAIGGHLEIERVLTSPWVDYLSAPHSYHARNRATGGMGHSRGLLESVRLHGKLWLTEMDEHPLGTEDHIGGDPEKHPETIARMRRSVLDPIQRGMGLWYYDHRIVPTGDIYRKFGWWDHPTLLAEVRKHRKLYDDYSQRRFDPAADVALVFDTSAYYHIACDWPPNVLHNASIEDLLADVAHAGVAYDCIYLFDIDRIDWSRYKAVVFANAYHLPAERRQSIKERIATDQRHLVWLYAAGYSDGKQIAPGLVTDITGIGVARTSGHQAMTTGGCGLPEASLKAARPPQPLFAIDDSDAELAGHFSESAEGAAARKRLADSVSWFFSLPPNDSALLREVLRQAGAHIYLEAPDALIVGGGLVTVHTVDGGKRRIQLRSGSAVDMDLPPISTTVLDAETGDVILG